MAGSNVHELRSKTGSESEKITINLGHVDLGHIDLLVRDGFYESMSWRKPVRPPATYGPRRNMAGTE